MIPDYLEDDPFPLTPPPDGPPPMGDWSTRRLVGHLMTAWTRGCLPLQCRVRGVTVETLREELVRREAVGVLS